MQHKTDANDPTPISPANPTEHSLILDYTRVLGRGNRATVILGSLNNQPVAVKMTRIRTSCPLDISKSTNEKDIMKLLTLNNASNVIRYVGFIQRPIRYDIIMEFAAHGTLLDHLLSRVVISWGTRQRFIQDLTRGLAEIHKYGIIHCDIKPENILLCQTATGELQAKISDFGFAVKVSDPPCFGSGTPLYMAPEIINGEKNTQHSDVFSLGMSILAIIKRKEPYEKIVDREILRCHITAGHRETLPRKSRHYPYPSIFNPVMTECWEQQPDARPTAEKVLAKITAAPIIEVETISRGRKRGLEQSTAHTSETEPLSKRYKR